MPLAFDIHRHHVIHAQQFGECIRSDVVLIGIDEVQFSPSGGKLHRGFVLVDCLERSVMGDGSVAEGKPPRARDPLRRLVAGNHFRGQKKLLDLIFGEIGLVGAIHES